MLTYHYNSMSLRFPTCPTKAGFNRRSNLLLLMSLFFLFFFIGESISQQRTFIIKGKIVDEETQLPLEGAIVQISKTTLGATTNSDGNFAIYYVFAGVYSLRFAFVGYGSFQLDSVHIMSDTTLPTIELETSGVTLGCDFHIMTTGELNAIKDSDGLLKQNTIVLISYGLITPEMKEFARKYNSLHKRSYK